MTSPPLRVLIVDDEQLARDRLTEVIAPRSDTKIIGECRNGRDAIAAIRERQPDLVLLDVQMPEVDGIGVLEALRPEEVPVVIFVTAYDQYALKAFELHAVDYLLKPFSDERLEQALERAKDQIHRGQMDRLSQRLLALLREISSPPVEPKVVAPADAPADPSDRIDRLAVRSGNRWILINAGDIDWIEGAGVYARIVVGERSHLLRTTLAELDERLHPQTFLRIHRSTIVNITRVKEIKPHAHGEFVLLLEDGTKLKVSRSYSEQVRAFLEQIS